MSFGGPSESEDRVGNVGEVSGAPKTGFHGPYPHVVTLGVPFSFRWGDASPLSRTRPEGGSSGVPCAGGPPVPVSSSVVTPGPGTVSGSVLYFGEVILRQVYLVVEAHVGSNSVVSIPGASVVSLSGTEITKDVSSFVSESNRFLPICFFVYLVK